MPLVSVVAPFFNEAEVATQFHDALRKVVMTLDDVDVELVFVDDGSADETLLHLNALASLHPDIRVYSLSRNFGHQVALSAGLDVARGDAVILMDSDLQHPPELIPELIRQWRQGVDIVATIRTSTEGESFFKATTSRGFYTILNALSSTKVTAGAADFCLLSRRVVQVLNSMPERHRFLRGLVSWVGFPRAQVLYVAPRRAAGHTKYSLQKMLTFSFDAIFSFSAEPLRMALRLGLGISGLGLVYLGWTLVNGYILGRLVPGYASVIAVTLILGGSQLCFIGLLGQYLARVFEEVKGRPLYVFKQVPPDHSPGPIASGPTPRAFTHR